MGGNRGTFSGGQPEVFGAPESFEKAFADAPAFNAAPRPSVPEMPGLNTEANVSTTPEMRPLSADGSTEGKLGKLAVQLSGEVLDEASAKEVEHKIAELKDNPYELQNYRDEAMVESLRDSFGRIFGDNSYEGGSSDE